VRANGRTVGSLRLADRCGEGWILDLGVQEGYRRRGYASVAVLTAEEVLRGWGCRTVRVALPASARPAHDLAVSMGYRPEAQNMVKRLAVRRPPLPEGLTVRPLRSGEYAEWIAGVESRFAEAVLVHRQLDAEAARQVASRARGRVLPDGLGTPGVAILVLEDGARVCGTLWVALSVERAAGRGWVYDVYVEPASRGRGHGRALMRLAERECGEARLVELGLNVFANNSMAIRLYASLGYTVESRTLSKRLS
jgi:GNAT superfamily N-acetyltransferase